MKNIKQGYLLKTTTWENDADNYATKELSGLIEDHVRFYLEIVNLFGSCHGSKGKQFGNADRFVSLKAPIQTEWVDPVPNERGYVFHRDNDDLLPLRVKQIVDRYREAGKSIPKYWDYTIDDEDWHKPDQMISRSDFYDYYADLLYDLIGSWADGEYWRVFDSFEVFYVEAPIKNVTDQFKV